MMNHWIQNQGKTKIFLSDILRSQSCHDSGPKVANFMFLIIISDHSLKRSKLCQLKEISQQSQFQENDWMIFVEIDLIKYVKIFYQNTSLESSKN
jgi:hypothetical protein